MINFEFYTPTEILFGKNQIEKLGSRIKGRRVLLVYGFRSIKKIGLYNKVISILKENQIFYKELSGVEPNPKLSSVKKGIQLAKENKIDFVLAVGGGSVIDCAKTIALGFYYQSDPWELMSIFDRKREKDISKALPIGTILTLSATGTEMNANAVITNQKTKEKAAFYNPMVKPRFSILDPTYTFTVSKYQTGCGVADIMSHIFEQYFSRTKCSYIQNTLAESLLKVCIKYGKIAINIPDHYDARSNLMWASSLALNGLIGAGKEGDWSTHAMEHGVSAINDMAHGAGLAILFPRWMEFVLKNSDATNNFYEYGKNVWGLTGDKQSVAEQSIKKTKEFFETIGMPSRLSNQGIKKEDINLIVEKTMLGAKRIGTFVKLDKNDVKTILKMAY